MDVKIGGTALAIIVVGLGIAFGVNECQRGPLNPELPDNLGDEQTAWLTLEHRIKRADPALVEVSRDQQTLTIRYWPQKAADNEEAWVPRMLRTVGQGLAAVNSAPGGKQYTQVMIKARIVAAGVSKYYPLRPLAPSRASHAPTFHGCPGSVNASNPVAARLARERNDTLFRTGQGRQKGRPKSPFFACCLLTRH